MKSSIPQSLQGKLLRIREQIQNEHRQTDKDNLFNPLVSPGPASIVLLDKKELSESDDDKKKSGDETTVTTKKGMFAAAAIAAAVTRPLPLKKTRSQSDVGSTTTSTKNDLKEFKVKDSYIVNINSNIITCICGENETITKAPLLGLSNDSIQCNHCNRWQHLKCYGLKNKLDILPIKFYCNICRPGLTVDSYKINKKSSMKGKLLQQQKEKMKNLNLQIQIQVQKQLNLNILNTNNNTTTGNYDTSPSLSSSSLSRKNSTEVQNTKTDLNVYRDKYIKSFIEDHDNDDWVTPINKGLQISSEFIEVKEIPSEKNTMGIFATRSFKAKDCIVEYPGIIDFQKNYISDPKNQYRICGTTQQQVLFHPHWPILVDARPFSDIDHKSKYLRRGCTPNVELSTINISNKHQIKFIINAIKDVQPGDELLIGWQWDLRHPICQMINNTYAIDSINDMDKYWLVHSIDTIWQLFQCGCHDQSSCKLLEIKKYADSFLKDLKESKKKANISK